jgi:flavin reductase (DIM6/NTAB) family NADH-FMN oxidoreductase RutF
MEFDADRLPVQDRYKLLTGLVFPRPIALVSTYSASRVPNCAPYSWFNAVCEDPMLVVISFAPRSDGDPKHSFANIVRSGEFVVNLVDEAIANAMHRSSAEYPEQVSEFAETGLTPAPCRRVDHPRVLEAPASLECRLFRHIQIGPARDIVLGEVVYMHVRDGVVDPANRRIVDEAYLPVGRLFGTRYCTTRQRFELPGDLPG